MSWFSSRGLARAREGRRRNGFCSSASERRFVLIIYVRLGSSVRVCVCARQDATTMIVYTELF